MNLEILRNKLIVLEGIDHCGKTTVGKLMAKTLNEAGIPAIFTFQPGDNEGEYNQIMHDMCKTKKYDLDPLSNLFAFLLDRSEHTSKKVIPNLEDGATVICDRWWYSTVAYQFFGKQLLERFDLTPDFAFWLNKVASHNITPHYSFFLQRPQELVEAHEDDAQDLFETEGDKFKARVVTGYNTLIKNGDLKVINVSPEPEVTMETIVNAII